MRFPKWGLWLLLGMAFGAASVLAQTGDATVHGAQDAAQDAELLYLRALQAIASNDLGGAQALLQRLVLARPEHAGALLDLAELYCQLGDGQRAQALWREVETRFAPPAGILALIDLQRQQGCARKLGAGGLRLQVQAVRGHASNVNQGVRDLTVGLTGPAGPMVLQLLPQYAPVGDHFTQLNGTVRQSLGAFDLQGFAQWQGRRYDTHNRFDAQDFTFGLSQPWSKGSWDGRWQAGLGSTQLGGVVYQRRHQLQAWVTPPWQPSGPWRWRVASGLSNWRYPTLSAFDALQWDARLHLEGSGAAGRLQAQMGVSRDQGSSLRPGGDRDGWNLGVDWQRQLGSLGAQPVVAGLAMDWQKWASRQSYAPGFIEARRHQETVSASAALVFPLKDNAAWLLEARQVRNNENIGLFAYDVRTLQLSYHKRWGPSGQ